MATLFRYPGYFIGATFHLYIFYISVRYRVGATGEQDELALDGGSEDSSELPEGSMSVVYQLSGQHIKE